MTDGALTKVVARVAGAFYLGTIVCGLFAEVVSRGSLIRWGDAAATAHAILDHPALFHAGLLADVLMLVCYLAVTVLFDALVRPVSPRLSKMATVFSLTGIAVLAADSLLLLLPDRVLGSAGYLAPFTAGQRQAAVLLCLRLHGAGYDVSLVFFGVYCLLLAILFWRGGLVPKAIAALMGLAGLCYLLNSIAGLGAPGWTLSPHLMDPTLLGEAALTVWLLAFGARPPSVRRLVA